MPAERIVVTGAAGALGEVVVERLNADGVAVIAIDIGEAAALPPDAALRLARVDLSDEAATRRAFAEVEARLGRLNGLVNVAGGFAWETVGEGSSATWDRLYQLNLKTALHACAAALPLLEEGGSIVNIGAAAAARAGIGMAAYAASKSGVARLTEALATELKPRRIRVNAVLPSIIDTPANRAAMPAADFTSWVTPGELAHVIAFLLSDEASGITGASIPVTGWV
jgi:NAD(P)-dependent dehydrogenase (short-subunit alcohol dehydrogenase family)